MSKNIVFEGWLTKSPPTKRIWRTKWRRRWFALRQSGELPGQYFLDYYADRNCRRPKGTINLDLCEQVDAGLHMERTGTGSLDPKLRGSVFTIQTQSRTYHLEADCEAEMAKWVDVICRVCGLRATDDSTDEMDTYQNRVSAISAMNGYYECADNTGPYIPISECITGVRSQEQAFTFDPKNIVMSARTPLERVSDVRNNQIIANQPHVRHLYAEFSENESNLSDDECKSLNASQSNIPDWSVVKSFTKMPKSNNGNVIFEDGPPVPPRPPKTFIKTRDVLQKETLQVPKIHEPVESDNISTHGLGVTGLRIPRRATRGGKSPSPTRSILIPASMRHIEDDEECSPGHLYCNLTSLPPAVDRALKPRRCNHSITHINTLISQGLQLRHTEEMKLQYLDLDLHTSQSISPNTQRATRNINIKHEKSFSALDADSAYKTVDFLKTEAFNITRQDAEASRSSHH